GLSYTTFAYRDLQVGSPTEAGFEATVVVENTGAVAADEVVQFYLSALDSQSPAPLSQLIGFQRVRLEPGQCRTVALAVKPEMLMLVDDNGQQVLHPGRFRLTAGGCSPSSRGQTLGAAEPVSAEFALDLAVR
ncbi:MAG: fibronectin type III-like domain-contianing protein, partial [Anaerolineales bacterium]|nr:fibronectin type III-like domain-contianing protein [Anaerolineales bacterium]